MMTLRKAIFSLAILLLAAPLALAQGTYTQIDEPNAVFGTYVQGVDTAGDIVGTYLDASFLYHGFILSGGTYTTIDYPGGVGTFLTGLNDAGTIVGITSSRPQIGFLYDAANQTFTNISYPRATATYPYAINNAGTVVGYFSYDGGPVSGFELTGATYRAIKPPSVSNSYVYGVSSLGVLAGYVPSIKGTNVDFLFKQGKYVPMTIPNAPNAAVYGISPESTALVGAYVPSSGIIAGFLYENKTLQTLEFSGANTTYAYGINSSGEVVGTFYDANADIHGFIWTPPAAAEKK